MTLADEAKLYIIEPYSEPKNDSHRTKGVRNQRRLQKEHRENETFEDTYLHCSDFYLGNQRLQVRSGSGGSLKYDTDNYETIQVFFNMLDLEKTITLSVGKSRSFNFVDTYGDKVQCFINKVTLLDVWKDTEEHLKQRLSATKYTEHLSEEQLQEINEHYHKALEQSCPKGMCYIGIEYECSKDLSLQFYSKEYLKSVPITHKGSSSFLMMSLKPDKEIGPHNLPLKRCVIQTAVSPDTTKIPAELFSYYEKVAEWEENV